MNVEELMNVLMKAITEGTIDGKSTIYVDPNMLHVGCMFTAKQVAGAKVVKVGNGHKVVIS